MLDKPNLKLAYPPCYTALDMDNAVKMERRRARKMIRLIWFTSMLVTVMICAALRRNPWIDIPWWIIPAVGVTVNAVYFIVMIKMLFPSVPKEGRA